MLRIFGLLALLMLTTHVAATEVDISAGSESFLWQEFADNGEQYLEETGLRHFVDIQGVNHYHPLWSTGFAARFYSGVVDYDGQTMDGDPVITEVDYNGMRFELGLFRRVGNLAMQPGQGQWWLDFVLGNDMWRRYLRDTALSDGSPVSGYTERYSSIYGRLGANYINPLGLSAAFGAKLPFYTEEEVKLAGDTLLLNPEGRLSLYARLGYALSAAWGLSIAYDSYRFAKSDEVQNGGYLYHQPESSQDTLAFAAHFRF